MTPSPWDTFWRIHSSDFREAPALFRAADHPGAPLDSETLFEAAVRLCEAFTRLPRANRLSFSRIRFYVDGRRIEEPQEHLMRREDADFAGWRDRLERTLDNYCIIFTHLESTLGASVIDVQDFLRTVVDALGFPAKKSELTLFAGRYEKTPFGIHRDPELNLYWPLTGPKRMRFWKPDYNPEPGIRALREYAGLLPESLLLEAQAGDMMIWPGDWWHIAEGNGDFNVSLTIPLAWYPHVTPNTGTDEALDAVAKALLPIAAARSRSTLTPYENNEDTSAKLPPAIVETMNMFCSLQGDALRDLLTEQWLKRLSSFGLAVASPVQAEVALREDDFIGGTPDGIRWGRLSGERICVASRGNSVVLSESPLLVDLIRRINTGLPIRVGSIPGPSPRPDSNALVSFYLIMLARIGGIRNVESSPSESRS